METRICTSCNEEKVLVDNFSRKRDGRNTRCKTCVNRFNKKRYKKNKSYYKKKAVESNKKYRARNLQYTIDYLKQHPCVDCGEPDPVVLDFDHLSNKICSVAKIVAKALSLESLIKEIAKCEVRCANCHRRKTAKQFAWYKHVKL